MNLSSADFFQEQLKALILEAVKSAYPNLENPPVEVEYPADPQHGDYACSIALKLSKELGANPREIAQKIVDSLPKNELIEKTDIAGPGFINLFLSEKVLHENLQNILSQKEHYADLKVGEGKNLILEYSSPNIAKPLGVHHLLSTVIGQSLCNIFNKIGFKTISINHVGDWGTQFGKLTVAFRKWGKREEVEKDPINEFLKLYVKFHDEAEQKPELEDEARAEFQKFEQGDKENRELWQWFVDESLKAVQKTYDKLGGIHFDHIQGESFYEDKMEKILQLGKEKKVFEPGEKGALVINFEDDNIPTLPVQKKDGTTLYITRDLAALKYRKETWDPAEVIYVVDTAQSLHFKQLFSAASRLGIAENIGKHVSFGRMRMKDGSMSTRKGNVVLLDEVLAEAENRASKIIEEKSPDLENRAQVAETVGIGAVKYNILSQNRSTDITFDWDTMLALDGNSAPYLQYTYARARSILRRQNDPQESIMKDPENAEQRSAALLRLFPKYPEQILRAAQEYKPNLISNYLYELAQLFNAFYNSVPVLRAASEESKKLRLQIVEATAEILKDALALLCVEVEEKM